MYALADCNNFFASCERVFRPELNGRPVIVLSNNDGCAVARSNAAKALGIKMGDPLFKIRDIVEKNHVHVFSGNFALYGDMSRRVQEVLRTTPLPSRSTPSTRRSWTWTVSTWISTSTPRRFLGSAGGRPPFRCPWVSRRPRPSRRSPPSSARNTPNSGAAATCTGYRTSRRS